MSDSVDTLDNQNTNTQEQTVEDVVSLEDNSITSDNTESDTIVDIDSMSDEEFAAFMNNSTSTTTIEEVEDKKEEVLNEKEQTTTPEVKEDSEVKEDTKESTKEDSKVPEEYAAIFKPFKANGKEIAPKTVEDVISLMQMGANYTKKMQLMAPMKRTIESLNKAEIKDEDLNFLIDIHKGDKEAIKKLLEKHKVDPLELDMENTNYAPKDNMISNSDVEYLSALEDIQSSLPKIQEIIGSKWDSDSKTALLKDPALLRGLHEEIEMGRFDLVQSQLEVERTFGRYKGMSDVQAYVAIVTKMQEEQHLANTIPSTQVNNSTTTTTNTVQKPIPDKSKAAPVKGTSHNKGSTLTTQDIIGTSDEEFLRLIEKGLV